MSLRRQNRLKEFDRKVGLVTNAISKTLNSIEGKRVQPWNFGLTGDGSVCGIIKVDEIAKDELFSLKEIADGGKFKVLLACNGHCYEIGDEVKKYSGHSAVSMKDKINREISNFRMNLIRL